MHLLHAPTISIMDKLREKSNQDLFRQTIILATIFGKKKSNQKTYRKNKGQSVQEQIYPKF